jgi:CO dehydrogenase maturation factor
VRKVETLIIVSDPTRVGLKTVTRLHALAREMALEYRRLAIIVNGLRGRQRSEVLDEVKKQTGAEWVIGLPFDAEIQALAEQGKPLTSLADDNPVLPKIDAFLADLA